MPSGRPPILWSKLRTPTSLVPIIERPRLVDQLIDRASETDAQPVRPVWVLAAPTGFGKTTLAEQAVSELTHATVWLSVDDRDNDPMRFLAHLSAGLADTGVDVGDADTLLAMSSSGRAVDELVAAIERHPDPIVLVLDDVHELVGADAVDALTRLLAIAGEHTTVVLLGRHDLALPIPRLRAAGLVVDIDAAELSFTDDEAKRSLQRDLDDGVLDESAADGLVARLDGWPAGLQLARLAIRSSERSSDVAAAVSGAHPDLADYLAGEVVDGLEPTDRDFLITTSILDDLTPGACDAVTERPGSLAALRRLTTGHVFTTLVEPATSTYRYHRVLREFAASRLAERPIAERNELHRRAARWFAGRNDPDAVIRHAAAAGDVDMALAQMTDNYIATANQGQIDTLWRWVELIGAESVLADPVVGPLPAWASLNQHRYDEIEPWLAAIDLVDGINAEHRAGFDMQAAAIRSNRDRHLGDLTGALKHGLEAAALADAHPELLAVASARSSLGAALALSGDPRAPDQLERAIAAAQSHGEGSSVVMSYAHLGLAVDDLATAEACADSALAHVTSADLERFHRPAAAWLVRARVARESGRVGDAAAAIERGRGLAAVGREPATSALLDVECARLAHVLGDAPTARARLRAASDTAESLTGGGAVLEAIQSARAETRFAPSVDDDELPLGARELSEREFAVLRLLPHGLPRRELARQLFVSENTVKTHLTSIRRKLGLAGRADIVGRARELGLLADEA